MKSKKKLVLQMCSALLICAALLPCVTVFALQGGDITQYQKSYANGTAGAALMPDVVTLPDGIIAYAIEPQKVSTRKDTVYEAYTESNEAFRTGIEIIMEYGYPLNMNSTSEPLDTDPTLAADKARYATSVAILSWAIHNGAAAPDGWADYVATPSALTAAEGCENVVSFIRFLCEKALAQSQMTHSITAKNANGPISTLKMDVNSDSCKVGFTVELSNINQGYMLDISNLPNGTKAEGYTGYNGDNVTLNIPAATNDSYTVKLIGKDDRITSNFAMYTPKDQAEVSKLIAMTMATPFTSENVAEIEITLSRTSGDQWSFADAAPSTPAPEPPAATGSFPSVPGCIVVYDKGTGKPLSGISLSVTDAQGTQKKSGTTDENGCLSITDLPAGKYYCSQTDAAQGYSTDAARHKFGVVLTTNRSLFKGDTVILCASKRITIIIKNNDVPMPGIKFAMTDESGQIALSQITDENGTAYYTGLANGTYGVKFESAPESTPKDHVEALQKLTREIHVTDDLDSNTAIYTFDIASMIGTKKAKTGEAEVRLATRFAFIAALTVLVIFGTWKILTYNED